MRELTAIEHNLVSAGATQSESDITLSRPASALLFSSVGAFIGLCIEKGGYFYSVLKSSKDNVWVKPSHPFAVALAISGAVIGAYRPLNIHVSHSPSA